MVCSSWQQLRCQPGSWSHIQGLAPLSSSLPEQPVQDLRPQGKVSGGRSREGGHQERKGHNLPAPGPGQLPTTHRFTPIEPLHFPCVLGKSETGTEVLRKDKGGGREDGQESVHVTQGSSQGEEEPRPWSTCALCPLLRGAGHCGERSTWGHQVPHLSGEGGGSTRKKEPLISCLSSSSQPTASSLCWKRIRVMQAP